MKTITRRTALAASVTLPLLPVASYATPADCTFRSIRSLVPTASGQGFRGIRSPWRDAAELGFLMTVTGPAVKRCAEPAPDLIRGRPGHQWEGPARGAACLIHS